MNKPTTPKMSRPPTEEERLRLAALREKIKQEVPDLVARNQMREDARREPSLSGALRRAVHASKRPLTHLAREIGIEPTALDEFLTGERNLRSDIMDRLARSVGYDLSPPTAAQTEGLADPSSPNVART
jgi:plasmid maintenance system antidote protein VapI